MNAILAELSPHSIAAEIRLERSVRHVSFLLTEGWDDVAFFKKIVDSEYCSITVCHGRDRVLEVVAILRASGYDGILGIVDADFAKLLGETFADDNICVTDMNDLDCMVFCSEALDKVLIEFGSQQKLLSVQRSSRTDIRSIILEQAAVIGSIRFAARRNEWPLKFRGMNYKFTSNADTVVEIDKTIEHVLARSTECDHLTCEEVAVESFNVRSLGLDPIEICNGLDIRRILARAFKKLIGSYNGFDGESRTRDIGRILRLAYERREFLETQLCQCIVAWEGRNKPFRVLRSNP